MIKAILLRLTDAIIFLRMANHMGEFIMVITASLDLILTFTNPILYYYDFSDGTLDLSFIDMDGDNSGSMSFHYAI